LKGAPLIQTLIVVPAKRANMEILESMEQLPETVDESKIAWRMAQGNDKKEISLTA
jgi:hypothetical protein